MRRKEVICGTRSGYVYHLRAKEPACQPCKDADRSYKQQYSVLNKEKIQQYASEYQKSHKEQINEASRKYRANNPEKRKQIVKAWNDANKDKRRATWHRRRARLNSCETEFFTENQILETYGTDCHICNEPIDLDAPRHCGEDGWEKGLHLDHVIPISKGGTNTVGNVKPAHGFCNVSKNGLDKSYNSVKLV